MKYLANFERDYNWYLKYKDKFTFSGSLPESFNIDLINGKTAKECFYIRDTYGKKKFTEISCKEPELLAQILLCKESINFHIKMWAESRAEGTLGLQEFSKRMCKITYLDYIVTNTNDLLVWETIDNNIVSIYYKDMETYHELLNWMVLAVENQKWKYYKDISHLEIPIKLTKFQKLILNLKKLWKRINLILKNGKQ